ncbi:MAG: hypothetical protein QW128_09065 [Thermoprotei archaeon]
MGYSVLFMAMSGGGRGYWLRYTSLVGLNKKYSAYWLTVLGSREPRGLMIKAGSDLRISETTVSDEGRLFKLEEGVSKGDLKGFTWSLRFSRGESSYNPVPLWDS